MVDKSGQFLGPDVLLVRTLRSGDVVKEYLPIMVAKSLLIFNDLQNGNEFISGHIEFGDLLDIW